MPSHQQRRHARYAPQRYDADYAKGVTRIDRTDTFYRKVSAFTWPMPTRWEPIPAVAADPHLCPQCSGPSLRGDLCFNCTAGDSDGQYGHGV